MTMTDSSVAPAEALKRTKAGSRARDIIVAAALRTAELGRGLSVDELRDAYQVATGKQAPKSFTAEVSSLARRRVLKTVGGRVGHLLYAPIGSRIGSGAPPEDDMRLVLQAVHSGYRRLGCPLSTRQVLAECRRGRKALASSHPNTVRKHLEALTRGRTRGPKSLRPPQVQRVTVTTAKGSTSARWLPASAEIDPGAFVEPATLADALRVAVALAQGHLGRPVSRVELVGYLQSESAPIGITQVLFGENLGSQLATVAKVDRTYKGAPGRVHTVSTAFTCHGGAPVRYALGPVGEVSRALCTFEDVACALLPADELEGLGALERRADILGSVTLKEIAQVRRSLLTDALGQAVGGVRVEELHARASAATQCLRGWLLDTSTTPHQREKRERQLTHRERQLAAVFQVLGMPGTPPQPFARAGQQALVAMREMEALLQTATDRLDLKSAKGVRLLDRVRRYPNPKPPQGERFGAADDLPLSLLDRVDAVTEVFDLFPVPRAAALLRDARLVLGHVLRDAEILRRYLRSLSGVEDVARRALVVALGLLGAEVSFAEAVPNPASFEDTSAWVLATVVGNEHEALHRIEDAERRVRGTARRVTDMAAMRLRAGYCFSAIG